MLALNNTVRINGYEVITLAVLMERLLKALEEDKPMGVSITTNWEGKGN